MSQNAVVVLKVYVVMEIPFFVFKKPNESLEICSLEQIATIQFYFFLHKTILVC